MVLHSHTQPQLAHRVRTQNPLHFLRLVGIAVPTATMLLYVKTLQPVSLPIHHVNTVAVITRAPITLAPHLDLLIALIRQRPLVGTARAPRLQTFTAQQSLMRQLPTTTLVSPLACFKLIWPRKSVTAFRTREHPPTHLTTPKSTTRASLCVDLPCQLLVEQVEFCDIPTLETATAFDHGALLEVNRYLVIAS